MSKDDAQPSRPSIDSGHSSSNTMFDPGHRQRWLSGEPYHHDINKMNDPWEESFRLMRKFDEEMCRGWREDIDTNLVFAGLFSAAVTAFTVESYKWLEEDSSERSIRLFQQISRQLNNDTAHIQADPEFVATGSAVRINICWFTSLTLALTSVLVGILCKQWLREYQRYESLSPKEALPVRQMRYQGLKSWHVDAVVASLPLLLQSALVLFFVGLLDLLWSLQRLVAAVVTTLVGVSFLFLLVTSLLPTLQDLLYPSEDSRKHHSQCPYKSPQSLTIRHFFRKLRLARRPKFPPKPDSNWVEYDVSWAQGKYYMGQGFAWLNKKYCQNTEVIHTVYHCLDDLDSGVANECLSRILEQPSDRDEELRLTLKLEQETVSSSKTFRPTPKSGTILNEADRKEMILGNFLLLHSHSNEQLYHRCLEHFIRVLNTSIIDDHQVLDMRMKTLSVVIRGRYLSDALASQIAGCLSKFFIYGRWLGEPPASFWDVFRALQRYSKLCNNQLPHPAHSVLAGIEQWLMQPHLDPRERQNLAKKCALQIIGMSSEFSHLSSGRGSLLEDQQEFEQVASLLRALDRLLATSDGVDALLPWQKMKERYLSSSP